MRSSPFWHEPSGGRQPDANRPHRMKLAPGTTASLVGVPRCWSACRHWRGSIRTDAASGLAGSPGGNYAACRVAIRPLRPLGRDDRRRTSLCAWTISIAMASPSPEPGLVSSNRTPTAPARSSCAGVIPGPSSTTLIPAGRSSVTVIDTADRAHFPALSSRIESSSVRSSGCADLQFVAHVAIPPEQDAPRQRAGSRAAIPLTSRPAGP